MITIFSNPNINNSEEKESQKISYWLEKLFKQSEKKSEDKKRDKFPVKEKNILSNEYSEKLNPPFQNQTEKELQEKGQKEAIKNYSRKIDTDQHKLNNMMSKSNRIIVSISSLFPWDIFPDTLNIEETRITVIQRQLFSSQVHSVNIKDISNIFIDMDLFLAAITIVSNTFEENNIKIMKLRKKEAVLARRIIEGLRVFMEKDIDTSRYTTKELINKLKELSKTRIVS